MARTIEPYPSAFPDGWWNRAPWTLDPNGAVMRTPLQFQFPGRPPGRRPSGTVTLAGGKNGWESIVELSLEATTTKGQPVNLGRGWLNMPPGNADDFTRVPPDLLPLRGWTIDEMRYAIDLAERELESTQIQYRVAKVLRESQLLPTGDLTSASLGSTRRLTDVEFARVYRIVSERRGYAKFMAEMLHMAEQTVDNRVTDLRKRGLLPKTNRKNAAKVTKKTTKKTTKKATKKTTKKATKPGGQK